MKFVEYSDAYREAHHQFLQKLGRASPKPNSDLQFAYYGPSKDIVIRRHLIVDDAVSPELVVGSVDVKVQTYVIRQVAVQVAVVTYPVSLGLVEPRYAMVAVLLFRKVAETYPLNLLLGMGPPETNVTSKMCALLGWRVSPIPYLFMPRRLGALAAKQLASRPLLASLARTAGRMGLLSPVEAILRSRAIGGLAKRLRTTSVRQFDATLDAWWPSYAEEIGFSLVRDSAQMNAMFPETTGAFERITFHDGERLVGFAVLLVPDPAEAVRALGVNLVTLVEFSVFEDCLEAAAAALARALSDRQLDAVIANTPHGPTLRALRRHGFRDRTTAVYLAISRGLQSLLDKAEVRLEDMVITRGDGDGPIGLGVDL